METKVLVKRIILEHIYLDRNIMNHIKNKLNKLKNSCNKKDGYIIDILSLDEIIDHEISRSCNENIFLIKFNANIFKPKVGMKIKSKICMIYSEGILCESFGKQKIFIPKNLMEEIYTFKQNLNTCIYNGNNLNIDDTIITEIKAVRFNNKQFNCVGMILKT